MDKVDQKGTTPKQAKEVVETIVEMKNDVNNIVDEQYTSAFVQENNEKIKSAINEGISSKEVARTLVNSTRNANDTKSKKHLKFVTKLISKLKVKELRLRKDKESQMQKGRQKILK